MKVLHSIWSAGFGGIEKLALDLALAQKAAGLDPSILISRGAGELLEDLHREFPGCSSLGLTGGWDLSPSRYRRALDLCRVHDIVHIHSFNPLVALAAVRSRRRIVYTEHGSFGQGRKTTAADRVKKIMIRRLLNGHVDGVTFNSQWTRQTAEAHYGLMKTMRRVIYNGISLERHTRIDEEKVRQIRSRYDGAFIVGTTSRLAAVKRIDRLIDGFATFQSGRNTILLIVGDGMLRKKLEKQVLRLGISAKTVFAGFQQDVANWQSAMDVCVFPSRSESFGLVAVEALSLGKPTVIFRDAGGMAEIVKPLEARDVVADVPALAARLAAYDTSRELIVGDAQRRIERAGNFDITAMARETVRFYGDVLKGVGVSC